MKKIIALALIALLVFPAILSAGQKEIKLTTYYPAPYGEYKKLSSQEGSNFATTSGNVGVGTADPKSKLDVMGGVRNGSDNVACTSDKDGTLRYISASTSGGSTTPARYEYCDGKAATPQWRTFGGGSGLKTYVGATGAAYYPTQIRGYAGGDAKCAADFPGASMCQAADFRNGLPTEDGWYNTYGQRGAGSGDCLGWNSNDATAYGDSWNASGGCPLTQSTCSAQRRILCCK